MHTRHVFDKELEQLQIELIKMGSLVERSIERAVEALVTQDEAMSLEVFRSDDEIDELEKHIEQHCLNLIARQQPLAKDLRRIGAAMKVITDLERIADHASDIAQITITMTNEKYIKKLVDIPHMAQLAREMVRNALDAYMKDDVAMAHKVFDSDEEVDNLYFKIIVDLKAIMKADTSTIDQAVNFMSVAKYLERIGDHATNICEWVGYNVSGTHESFTNKAALGGNPKDRLSAMKDMEISDTF